jgi:hypothetical protein
MAKKATSAKQASNAKSKVKPSKAKAKSSSSEEDFIPEDAIGSGGASSFMKLEKGENKIRIISKPIAGWVEWIDKEPIRSPIDEEPEATDEENPPKKFLALVVIDRADDNVKVLEITQQSVIKAIRALSSNPDWGSPFSYDINIERTGEDLRTKYAVTPSPKKPLSKELIKAASKKPCDLEKLFESENPWEDVEEPTEYFFK